MILEFSLVYFSLFLHTGLVKLTVYSVYWNAVGRCLAPMVLTALFLMQGICSGVKLKHYFVYVILGESMLYCS